MISELKLPYESLPTAYFGHSKYAAWSKLQELVKVFYVLTNVLLLGNIKKAYIKNSDGDRLSLGKPQ